MQKPRNAHFMKTRLTIKKDDIAIDYVSLDNVAILEPVCDGPPISKLEVFFETVTSRRNIVGTRMYVAPVSYSVAKSSYIKVCYALGIR